MLAKEAGKETIPIRITLITDNFERRIADLVKDCKILFLADDIRKPAVVGLDKTIIKNLLSALPGTLKIIITRI
ncbi:MAG: hypothetical protein QM764_12765 [Chitinophagaceae bacterium]